MTLEQPNVKGDSPQSVAGEASPLIHALHPKGRPDDSGVQIASTKTDFEEFLYGKPKSEKTRGIDKSKVTDNPVAKVAGPPNLSNDFGMVTPAMFTAALMSGNLEPPANAKYANPDQQYLASQFKQTQADLASKVFSPADMKMLAEKHEVITDALSAKAATGVKAHTAINDFLSRNGLSPVATPVSENGIIVSAVSSINQSWDGRGKSVEPIELDGKKYDAFALKGVQKYTSQDGSVVYKLSDAKGDAVYVSPQPKGFANGAEFSNFTASHTPNSQQESESLRLRLPDVDKSATISLATLQDMPVGSHGESISYAFLENKIAMNEYGLAMKSGFTAGVERSISIGPDFDETVDAKKIAIWRTHNGEVVQQDLYSPEAWKAPPKDAIKR